jgi:hypothetical protein
MKIQTSLLVAGFVALLATPVFAQAFGDSMDRQTSNALRPGAPHLSDTPANSAGEVARNDTQFRKVIRPPNRCDPAAGVRQSPVNPSDPAASGFSPKACGHN